jgi:1,2-phenylacetyl-CoA epoxidase catalytic subunit
MNLKEKSWCTQNPNLMSKASMAAMSSTSGSQGILLSEILTKVNNAKDKPKKMAVLQQYDSPSLRMILKGAFDPNIVWAFTKQVTHHILQMNHL